MKSYPFLDIARRFNLDYGLVLWCAVFERYINDLMPHSSFLIMPRRDMWDVPQEVRVEIGKVVQEQMK